MHTSLRSSRALGELLAHCAGVGGSLLGRALRNVGFNSFKQDGEMNLDLTCFGIVFQLVKYNI